MNHSQEPLPLLPDGGATLITGGTGFVGTELIVRHLERTTDDLMLLVRADSHELAKRRIREETLGRLFGSDNIPDEFADRVFVVAADLEQPDFGLSPDQLDELAERIVRIVHSAASVRFDLPRGEAFAINVLGTQRVLEFARRCQKLGEDLRRVGIVSTAYVAGRHDGVFRETDAFVGQGLRNTYELSKLTAEGLVHSHEESLGVTLPVEIYRPAIVVGDSRSGWTTAFNVLYPPVRVFAMGRYPRVPYLGFSVMPGRRGSPVDVVPVDYVADGVFALSHDPEGGHGETFHLTAGWDAITVGEILELGEQYFRKDAPVVLDPRVFRRFVSPLVRRAASDEERERLSRLEALFPYFGMRTTFDDSVTRARLEELGVAMPPLFSEYFPRLMRFAELAQWKRSHRVNRAEALDLALEQLRLSGS